MASAGLVARRPRLEALPLGAAADLKGVPLAFESGTLGALFAGVSMPRGPKALEEPFFVERLR